MADAMEQVGICDEVIMNENEINFMVNKIGGQPKFLPQKSFDLKSCSNCSKQMVLISQLYCPLVNSVYHRVFYIAACVEPSCWNKISSWLIYRCQFPDFEYIKSLEVAKEAESNKVSFINKEWTNDASDWEIDEDDDVKLKSNADSTKQKLESIVSLNNVIEDERLNGGFDKSDGSSSENPSTCQESPIELGTKQVNDTIKEMFDNWKLNLQPKKLEFQDEKSPFAVSFEPYYLNVMNKSYFSENEKNSDLNLNLDDFKNMAIEEDKSITKSEEYEESYLKHGDKIFHKFRKSIDYCPYQVVRYARGSNPLYIKNNKDFNPDSIKCSHCGSKCDFEFQLMPALVNYLKCINNNISIEFGVVIVYTCSNSCWNDTDVYRLENAYVQSDPDEKFFI